MSPGEIEVRPAQFRDLPGVMALCASEGYGSYTENAEVTWRALTNPGVTALVAVRGEEVLGVAQMLRAG